MTASAVVKVKIHKLSSCCFTLEPALPRYRKMMRLCVCVCIWLSYEFFGPNTIHRSRELHFLLTETFH